MIDLHSHIIYGVDDGAKNLKEALSMAKAASDTGFTDVVCTPHFIADSEFASTKEQNLIILKDIKSKLAERSSQLKLHLGSEIYYDINTVEALSAGQASTMNESKYALVEVPRQKMNFASLLNYIFQMEIAGYRVILAHAERYDFIMEDPNHLASLIKRDVVIQMNLMSLSGKYGEAVQKTAKTMLDHNMVHIASTDAHNPKHYMDAAKAMDQLERHVGSDMFDELLIHNPAHVLKDEVFYPDNPIKVKKKGLFNFLKRK